MIRRTVTVPKMTRNVPQLTAQKRALKEDRPMRRLTIILLLAMLCALIPLAAEAVGPLVGTNCQFSWTAPTTNADGTPLTGPLTYNLWKLQGIQTAPARVADLTGLTTTSVLPGCPLAGQFTAFTDAMENGLESGFSNAFTYFVVIPNPPVGFTCAPTGVCSWTLPTANTDATAIAGPIITELWVMPSTATVPTGPPNFTSTGTSANIAGGLAAGRYTIAAKALTTPTVGGSTSESAVVTSPFVVSSGIPGAPINLLGK